MDYKNCFPVSENRETKTELVGDLSMKGLVLVLILGALLYASVAEALDYKEYKTAKAIDGASWSSVRAFVNAVSEGFNVANRDLAGKSRPLLYCQPFALNVDTLLTILDSEIKTMEEITHKPLPDNMPIGVVLLSGMQDTFPCKS
jgi:hypothetical protein